jgi:hypothetical protein
LVCFGFGWSFVIVKESTGRWKWLEVWSNLVDDVKTEYNFELNRWLCVKLWLSGWLEFPSDLPAQFCHFAEF